MEEIVVAIDIGTSKVCTIIGQVDKSNQVEILGKGLESCSGVKKGVIVDIESTSQAIRSSLGQAEELAKVKVQSAYVNIMGAHVTLVNNKSSVSVSGENREITQKDVDRLLYQVKDVPLPENRQIIDIIPRQFIVDGYDEIIDPVGMAGVKLEVDADIVAGKITSVQNILKSFEKLHLKVDGIIVEAMATGEVALTPEEKEMGAILIDIGGGITNISVFRNKCLVFYDSIPVGGDHITNDISLGLKIPYSDAEKLKREYELAQTSLIKHDHEITVNEINDNRKKSIHVSEIVEIIEARVQEIFALCKQMLQHAGQDFGLGAGIILTGGGISYVDGSMTIANEIFDLPVRVALVRASEPLKPEYANAFGLIRFIVSQRKTNEIGSEVKVLKQGSLLKDNKFIKKLSKLFNGFF